VFGKKTKQCCFVVVTLQKVMPVTRSECAESIKTLTSWLVRKYLTKYRFHQVSDAVTCPAQKHASFYLMGIHLHDCSDCVFEWFLGKVKMTTIATEWIDSTAASYTFVQTWYRCNICYLFEAILLTLKIIKSSHYWMCLQSDTAFFVVFGNYFRYFSRDKTLLW